jgi:3-isopropylmalate/(R)-2-methylmalate dehydratase small subunit
LTAVVTEAEAEALLSWLRDATVPELTVDLEAQTVAAGPLAFSFAIDPVRRLRLVNGWDDLDLTMRYAADFATFRDRRRTAHPWAFPTRP